MGIEPTLTALSGQCLRVYKARPKANISNPPENQEGIRILRIDAFVVVIPLIFLYSGAE